jgi:hypothetical protein
LFNELPLSGVKPTFFFGQQTVYVMTKARQNRQWLSCPGLTFGRLVGIQEEARLSANGFG